MEIKTLITCLQLLGIGFSFGLIGPCLFFCAPVLAAYVAAGREKPGKSLKRISSFLSGRVLAYALLGCLAGLSGGLLKTVMDAHCVRYFKPAAGIVSIVLGIIILLRKKEDEPCAAESYPAKARSFTGLFIAGFLIGCAPCGPLAVLLAEIALISKSAFQGLLYALAFGAGTFLSGLIAAGSIAGAIGLIPSKIFRIVCAILLISLGAMLLW